MNERIKGIRNALKLTQQEFADKIKIKRNTVATYEMGRSVPSDSAIALICKEFNVNETWLRTGEGDMFIQLTRDEQIEQFVGELLKDEDDSFKRRIISGLAALDAAGWQVLEEFLDSIQKKEGCRRSTQGNKPALCER